MSAFLEERVLSVHHWTDRLFSFTTTRDPALRFSNGHFTMIGLRVDGKPLLRAYSIVSANYEDHLEVLSIKVPDGPLTSRLQHIQVGDTGAAVPPHHPPGTGQRTRANQRRRTGRAQAQDPHGETAPRTPRLSPLEFMQRLAALVPRPRLHLIRFHGVLAPNAKLRAQVVPQVVPQEPEPPVQAAPPAECEATCAHHRPVRLRWAKLLKRVFEIDVAHCPNCGGELKIIAAIMEQPVIDKILTHLGLQARARPRAPARRSQLQAA